MANVQVAAFEGNPDISDSSGMFTLEFPRKHPGDSVRIIVNKDGNEVVNQHETSEVTLPSPVESGIVTILLCKAAIVRKWPGDITDSR